MERATGGSPWALALLVALLVAQPVLAAERVALLIGNARYRNTALALRNPANDAVALAQALRLLGFETEVLTDADDAAVARALPDFAARAKEADLALFFFAGHGVQIAGENYLLTADFQELTLDEVTARSLSLSDIRRAMGAARPHIGLVILDACRNNPFTSGGLAMPGLARSQGGAGLLIAYATDPGNVAYDGTGANSFFTQALIEYVATPDVEARLMFGRVRQQVALSTNGRQIPWVEESVLGEHFFKRSPAPRPLETVVSRDVEAWRAATAEGTVAGYRRYLDRFPDGLFRVFATERAEALAASRPGGGAETLGLAAAEDPARVSAALSTMGFLTQTRGQAAPEAELRVALASYAQQMAGDGLATPEQLYLDAAQVMVVLGSTTAQRIQTDMAALKSIELTLGMATRARAELSALAETDASAQRALTGADADITAIEAAQTRVLDRLDQSRTYYAELLGRGRRYFGGYFDRSLAALREKSRSVRDFEQSATDDAETFIRHATTLAETTPEGSYAWLADFLPGDRP